jgi:hypothetical protein
MNYKRKHPSKRKFRYLRRGWTGESKLLIRKQIDRDWRDKMIESMKNRD